MVAHPDPAAFAGSEEHLLLKYRAVIQEIGPMVPEFLPHGILIFFGEAAPDELREVSLVHDGNELHFPLVVGDLLKFVFPAQHDVPSPVWYRLTAVGDMANANLAELGHVVVHFDAATSASLPGAISVEPSLTALPPVGTTFELVGLKEHSHELIG